jgi:NADPH:quinone reductase-like Zn-dependent oxidoreductase
MKAIICTEYGPPDVLLLQEVGKPAPAAGEVLVKIHAASINYGDTVLVKGKPFISRLMGYGFLKPKYKILGTDIAGQVEAVGGNTKQFQPGDEVFGDISECGFGAFAEYVSVPENALTLKPANLTFEQAAAVPQAAVVALQGLRDVGRLRLGQQALINGASGGVGSFAVQISKAFGAEVTGVCSNRNLDMVRSIGADHVIDYTQEDFTQNEPRYDLVFDIVVNHTLSDYLRVLKPEGSYVACAFNPTSLFIGPVISKTGNKKVSSLIHKPAVKDLVFIKELIEAGKVVPVIDRCYPLDEIPQAMRFLERNQHRGKVVITVAHDGK